MDFSSLKDQDLLGLEAIAIHYYELRDSFLFLKIAFVFVMPPFTNKNWFLFCKNMKYFSVKILPNFLLGFLVKKSEKFPDNYLLIF